MTQYQRNPASEELFFLQFFAHHIPHIQLHTVACSASTMNWLHQCKFTWIYICNAAMNQPTVTLRRFTYRSINFCFDGDSWLLLFLSSCELSTESCGPAVSVTRFVPIHFAADFPCIIPASVTSETKVVPSKTAMIDPITGIAMLFPAILLICMSWQAIIFNSNVQSQTQTQPTNKQQQCTSIIVLSSLY